jgi:hypothetical protein
MSFGGYLILNRFYLESQCELGVLHSDQTYKYVLVSEGSSGEWLFNSEAQGAAAHWKRECSAQQEDKKGFGTFLEYSWKYFCTWSH